MVKGIDIFRLICAITPEEIFMPDKMKEDIVKFTEAIKEEEETIKLEKFEITNRSLDDVIEMLKNKYGIR
jgi:glycerol dehydrogenase-like iron-containing ADH family enzyme